MNLRDFLLGVATGVAVSVLVNQTTERVSPYMSSDRVLQGIKDEFRKESPIDATWIYAKPETIKHTVGELPVYRGGISRVVEGETESFEFTADARSGVVVDLVRV
ncbi:peptidase M4 [Caryophanon tenue]|uniref:Peptidase M4 n=1 Tax=Caryophanon tenue TaxID=33978 RepID=A0A1C0YMB1_9BACL|nr:peptidase M4 [Caryophanon tenue]OCS88300.1 peptidase M4 [Caryophanon tenue]